MTHRHPRRTAAVVLTAALIAVPATALAASPKRVSVKDNVFVAKSVTIKRGTTVRWVWAGKSPHNVTVVKGPVRFHSGTKTTGSYSRKFTRKGTYKLLCTVHAPDMKMTVTVR